MADKFPTPSTNGPANKFDVRADWGDADPLLSQSEANDQMGDVAHDSAGVNAHVGINPKTDLDMALAPNMFPRQKGHDSLTSEEALLT